MHQSICQAICLFSQGSLGWVCIPFASTNLQDKKTKQPEQALPHGPPTVFRPGADRNCCLCLPELLGNGRHFLAESGDDPSSSVTSRKRFTSGAETKSRFGLSKHLAPGQWCHAHGDYPVRPRLAEPWWNVGFGGGAACRVL